MVNKKEAKQRYVPTYAEKKLVKCKKGKERQYGNDLSGSLCTQSWVGSGWCAPGQKLWIRF